MRDEKPTEWMGSSLDDLAAMPRPVRQDLGWGISDVQNGGMPDKFTPLTEFGAGVIELKSSLKGEAYRGVIIYTLPDAVYVLHVFHKKSKTGRSIPRADKDIIEAAAREARERSAKAMKLKR